MRTMRKEGRINEPYKKWSLRWKTGDKTGATNNKTELIEVM